MHLFLFRSLACSPPKYSTSTDLPSVHLEQANALFNTILHAEVTPPSPHRPSSPTRPPATTNNSNNSATNGNGTTGTPTTPRRRLFAYHSPSAAAASTSNTSPTRRLDTPTDEAYSMSPVRAESRQILESPRRQLRNVCKTPYRVLDAPELADDFYVNVVDWSSTNVLGVGLGSSVYLWTAHTAAVSKLCDLSSTSDTVSSVAWVQKGSTLAVGTISGKLHIYDAVTLQLVRSYPAAHALRIGALAWNQHVLSSGSRDRMIQHRDVREQTLKPFKKSPGHRQEVCGLRWNGEGMGGVPSGMLASGGNDNKVCIWDLRGSRRPGLGGGGGGAGNGNGSMARGGAGSSIGAGGMGGGGQGQGTVSVGAEASVPGAEGGIGDTPLWKFHDHTAAVKALAWDPHVAGVLATGGGTQDKHIRFWNVLYGNKLSELDTGSQVRFLFSFHAYIPRIYSPPPRTHISCTDHSHPLTGLQPNLVPNLARARLHPRVLLHHRPKPNMHLEVPLARHGRLAHGAHLPCFISRDESGRGDDRDGGGGRDA